nr:MAG TPA: hypothetical protein [Caudoviricetes sp.]
MNINEIENILKKYTKWIDSTYHGAYIASQRREGSRKKEV